MSNYGYGDGSQQNGQQYNQYDAYQQYPRTDYHHVGVTQYSQLPGNVESDLPYVPMHGLMPQVSTDVGNMPDYQADYRPLYGSNDGGFSLAQQPQQHRYDAHSQSGSSQHNFQQSTAYVPQSQILIPVPHLPKQAVVPSKRSSISALGPAPVSSLPQRRVEPPPAPIPTPAPAAIHTPKVPSPAKRAKPNRRGPAKKNDSKIDEAESDDEEEDYTMDGIKTKSGRKVHKPSQFTPAAKTASKRRGAAAKKPVVDSLFCKVCDRGHSPKSNLIVFCDGCNTPYHQLCHVPVIDNLLITLPDAEWFCVSCDQKRGQRRLEMGHTGSNLTEEQKKSYLAGLPTSHLVQLVLHATAIHPDLGLFSPNAATILERVHQKHEAAILEERAKMVPIVYQPAIKPEIISLPSDATLEGQILKAVSLAERPMQNRDIKSYIEANYVIDPQSFRDRCGEEISRLITDGRLLLQSTGLVLNREPEDETGKAIQANAIKATAIKASNRADATANDSIAVENGVGGFVNEQYPTVAGIKLPPENPADDGFHMQETESPAFIHATPIDKAAD